jgi:hypothetical protein
VITFLELDAGNVSWGIELGLVSRIVPEREWDGGEPADFEDLPRSSDADELPRVVVVKSRDGEVPVRATGRIVLREVEGADVLTLPTLLRGAPGFVFDRLVVRGGGKPLLVLDAEAAFARHLRDPKPAYRP